VRDARQPPALLFSSFSISRAAALHAVADLEAILQHVVDVPVGRRDVRERGTRLPARVADPEDRVSGTTGPRDGDQLQ
jgi:hypothetical protein